MKIEKFRKLVACHTHTKFKTRTKLWSNIEKVHKATKFNQKAWPKPYIDFISYKIIDFIEFYIKKVRKKNHFKNDFFKLGNNVIFRKNYGKCKKSWRHKA